MFRADAPGHLWNDRLDIDDDLPVEHGVGIARKLAPRLDSPLPHLALRRIAPAADVIIGLLVRRDQAHFGAEFDRKIADGKPPFDRHIADSTARIFDGVAGTTSCSDVADQREDEILGGHAEWQPALEHHAHGFWPALDDRLRCQHMRQFARSDTERQRAKPAMRAGMAVAADDQTTGKAEAKLGSDDMDDTLTGLVDVEHLDADCRCFGPQTRQQFLPDLARAGPPSRRRNRVVRGRERQFWIVNRQTTALEIEQTARPAEIVQQMTIDMKEVGIIADLSDDMLVPDLGQQRTAGLFQSMSSLFGFSGRGIRR